MRTLLNSSTGLHRGLYQLGRVAVAVVCLLPSAYAAQVIVYQETFETDGEGIRYVTEGRGKLDPQPPPATFPGPSFWELNYNVSFVGVRAVAPAKRAAIVWRHDLPTDSVTEDALKLFDGVAVWLGDGRASKNVLFSPPPAGTGDDLLVTRLTAAGFTVVNDDTASDAPDPTTISFVVQSSSGGPDPTRFTTYQAPMISYNAPNHDDELISSIGETTQTDPGLVTVTAPGHPAAGGNTGTFPVLTSAQNVDTIGRNVPDGSTTIASYELSFPRLALTLADVDEMISGAFASTQVTGQIPTADLAAGEPGRWSFFDNDDNPVPGNPNNDATYGVRGTGRLVVSQAGTYTFAIGVDDAARLRIDLDQNGLDPGDTVFSEEDGSGFRVFGHDVTFAQAGTYDFEWVTLSTGANFGQELSVVVEPSSGVPVDPWDEFLFQLLGEDAGQEPVRLENDISVTTYVPMAMVTEQRPFLLVVEGGGALLGGPLTGFEGNGFWAGADLNEPSYEPLFSVPEMPRSLTMQSVDVRGLENVQVTVAVAGSDVDFEDPDFFRILADPDGAGPEPYVVLAEFRQFPVGDPNRGALGDILDGQKTILRSRFKDVTYDITGATDLVIRFEGHCTFFNEVMGFDNVRVTAKGPDLPEIKARREGANVVVEFTGVLQASDTVDGTYSDVNGATSPLVLTPGDRGTQQFYRARSP